MSPVEVERTAPVSLTGADGRLAPDAVGFSRVPLHRTDGIGRGWRRGRNKRWEYWCVIGPRFIVSLTVASIDYAGVLEGWVFDRESGRSIGRTAITPLGRGVRLPGSLGDGPAVGRARGLELGVDERHAGTGLLVVVDGAGEASGHAEAALVAALPPGHERLGVVVPWSRSRFQYTVKDVARPATGTIRVDGVEHRIDAGGAAWAVLDHGRGRWPYDVRWNWGAGSGEVDGRRIGIQVGGRWTVGSGATENALFVDGRMHKISEELRWDVGDPAALRPWRIHGARADLVLTPFHDKAGSTDLGVISTRGDQCFGVWSGWMATDDGERVRVDGAVGWAEDVHNRW